MIRINKYLSQCGVASRRAAEALIDAGRVAINGEKLDRQGAQVDEEHDVVTLDGKVVSPVDSKVYVLLNKPRQVVTTLDDPFRRKTVRHLLTALRDRVYPVGRLDYDTEGLLILTNDGELAHRLAHPRFQVKKVYDATVKGEFPQSAADRIAAGLEIEPGVIGRAQVEILEVSEIRSRLRLTLTEGRKREVRLLCQAVRHQVLTLKRIEYGGITDTELLPATGEC